MEELEALRFVKRVTDNTLVLPMPPSYRGQEVEVIVLKKALRPQVTSEEKMVILQKSKDELPK